MAKLAKKPSTGKSAASSRKRSNPKKEATSADWLAVRHQAIGRHRDAAFPRWRKH